MVTASLRTGMSALRTLVPPRLTVQGHSVTFSASLRRPEKAVEIKKAIITAAGKSQRTLPLQTLVDRDGHTKTALRIIIEEILSAGIQEICVVVCPGDQKAYEGAAGGQGGRLRFVEQTTPRGYGH